MVLILLLIGLSTADDLPDCSVTAEEGGTVILPVKVDLPEDSKLLQPIISWKNEDGIVHHYFITKEDNEYQLNHYKNRTSLFKEEIIKGNVSLKIKNVTLNDRGKYTCEVIYEEPDIDIETYSVFLRVTRKKHLVERAPILFLVIYAAILDLVNLVAWKLAAGNPDIISKLLVALLVIGLLYGLMDPELQSLLAEELSKSHNRADRPKKKSAQADEDNGGLFTPSPRHSDWTEVCSARGFFGQHLRAMSSMSTLAEEIQREYPFPFSPPLPIFSYQPDESFEDWIKERRY